MDSNPGVNSEPLQVVQPESEREYMEPFDIRGIIYKSYNIIFISYTLKLCCYVATQSYSHRSSKNKVYLNFIFNLVFCLHKYTPSQTLIVTGQHTACQWLKPLVQIYVRE